MELEDVSDISESLIDEVSKAIVGKRSVLQKTLLGILANGNILFEDYPGLAKTLLSNCFARTLGCDFKRIQFTPDLLPADITGSFIYDKNTGDFKMRKGPIFTNILLADEVNRAPPKTQAALLEAMQEKQTTIEGETHTLDNPFIVIATQNPIEYEGTYPLPEAQVDRFLLRLDVGYPSASDEVEILKRRKDRKTDDVEINRVTDPETLIDMQNKIEDVHLDDDIKKYIVNIVQRTRNNKDVEVGSSPRGSLALMKLSMANAAMRGRDYVVPDDVKFIANEALSHRLVLKPGPAIKGVEEEEIINQTLKAVPVPKVD
ncbi:MAG: MoxR family ATPase [Candidatus Thermoplasmatota archaeon]|nr:MoxR family ATPase [Candidatus Thermoplasmatota archaeon]MBS3790054.1 MoxR family ATPase [Candidatus Thermoplasmatota archaeon]